MKPSQYYVGSNGDRRSGRGKLDRRVSLTARGSVTPGVAVWAMVFGLLASGPGRAGEATVKKASPHAGKAPAAVCQRGQGPGMMHGPGMGMMRGAGADMQTIHRLFWQSGKIKRTVKQLPNGVETVTESTDPSVAALIQEHVAAMQARLKSGQPIRRWDPLFAAIFEHVDKIKLEITPTKNGVKIAETSTDPYVVKLIHSHAQAVSGFIKDGPGGMSKSHEVPPPAVTPGTNKPQFLGRGDGITKCPVTGEPVDRNIKSTINGRTVYFCCASCVAKVRKNPELYLQPKAR